MPSKTYAAHRSAGSASVAIEREFVTGAFGLISLVPGYLFGSSRARL